MKQFMLFLLALILCGCSGSNDNNAVVQNKVKLNSPETTTKSTNKSRQDIQELTPIMSTPNVLGNKLETTFYANGNKKSEGNTMGSMGIIIPVRIRIGNWTFWHENGNKEAEGEFENGIPIGKWTAWHSNGVKAIEGKFNGWAPGGDATDAYRGNWKMFMMSAYGHVGTWTYWNQFGMKSYEETYDDNGVLIEREVFIESEAIPPIKRKIKTWSGRDTWNPISKSQSWLKEQQHENGYWTSGEGDSKPNIVITSLVLKYYFGDGHNTRSGKYKKVVKKGMDWLISQQNKDGLIGKDKHDHAYALSTLQIAIGMGDNQYKENLQKACDYAVDHLIDLKSDGDPMNDLLIMSSLLLAKKLSIMPLNENLNALAQMLFEKAKKYIDNLPDETPPLKKMLVMSAAYKMAITANIITKREEIEDVSKFFVKHNPSTWSNNKEKSHFTNDEMLALRFCTPFAYNFHDEYWTSWNAGTKKLIRNAQHKDGYWECEKGSKWGNVGTTALVGFCNTVYMCYRPIIMDKRY